MTKKRQPLPAAAEQLCATIAEAMLDKKAQRVASLNLSRIDGAIATCFVICSANSTTQVEAIAENVEDQVRKTLGEKPLRREGFENATWIILDYVDVMVHIFQTEARSFYRLEALWADAEQQLYGEEQPAAATKIDRPKAAAKRKPPATKADAEAGKAELPDEDADVPDAAAAKKPAATKKTASATKKALSAKPTKPAAAKKTTTATKKTATATKKADPPK